MSALMDIGVAQSSIGRYSDIPFEKVGIYTYEYITPNDTISIDYEVEKYAVNHPSKRFLDRDTSLHVDEFVLYVTRKGNCSAYADTCLIGGDAWEK